MTFKAPCKPDAESSFYWLDLYYGLLSAALYAPEETRGLFIEAARAIQRRVDSDPEPTKLTREQIKAQLAKDGVTQ